MPEWGQHVWVHNDTGSKLDAQAIEGYWVGYDKDSTHAHRIYWPNKNSVLVERNIRFAPTTVTINAAPGYSGITPPSTHPPIPQLALPAPPTITRVMPRNVPLLDSDSDDEQENEEEQGEEEDQQPDPTLPGQFESPAARKAKATKSQKSIAPSYTQPTRTSMRKKKPSEYIKWLKTGKDTIDGRSAASSGGQGSRRKKSGAAAAFTYDNAVDLSADCAFLAGLTPSLAAIISNTHDNPSSVEEAQSCSD